MARRTLHSELHHRGLTVIQVAALTGLSRSLIYKAAAGKPISTPSTKAIADALGMSIEELDKVLKRSRGKEAR